jgi:predicted aconitase with swiveling domain
MLLQLGFSSGVGWPSLIVLQTEGTLVAAVYCASANSICTSACIVARASCVLQTEGNLVSELGFGPWRKANEDFLATFERSYQVSLHGHL